MVEFERPSPAGAFPLFRSYALIPRTSADLVVNSIRHGRATQIRIAGECRDGSVRFSVRDNGQARILHHGRDCIKSHLKTAFSRLGAASRAEAVSIAQRMNLLKV